MTSSGSIPGTIPAGTATGSGYLVRVVSSNFALTAADNGSNILISDVTGVQTHNNSNCNIYFSGNDLMADMHNATLKTSVLKIYSIEGKEMGSFSLETVSYTHLTLPTNREV